MMIPKEVITLSITFSTYPRQGTIMVDFVVEFAPSYYNVIFGRPLQNDIKAIVLTLHLKIKFPTNNGVGEMLVD